MRNEQHDGSVTTASIERRVAALRRRLVLRARLKALLSREDVDSASYQRELMSLRRAAGTPVRRKD